jgi:hypothetical protein
MNAYVVFRSLEAAKAALSLNGSVFEALHLRVDTVVSGVEAPADGASPAAAFALGGGIKYDPKRTVFVGNLSWDIADEEVRGLFVDKCSGGGAAVESVRVVRDRVTNRGKGFCFVLLKDRTNVAEALMAHGTKLKGRDVRVTRCSADGKPLGGANRKAVDVRKERLGPGGKAKPDFMGTAAAAEATKQEERKQKKKDRGRVKKDKLTGLPKPLLTAIRTGSATAATTSTAAVRKPAGDKPAAEKPAAAKPVASKPAAEKPAAAKPVASKPAAVAKPAAEKPAAAKPAAAKPVAVAIPKPTDAAAAKKKGASPWPKKQKLNDGSAAPSSASKAAGGKADKAKADPDMRMIAQLAAAARKARTD